jgi:type I restriction enzyme S subunit
MSWPDVLLKYIARLEYGGSAPTDEADRQGAVQVFGSNGPYALCSQANTTAPVIVVGRKGSYGKVNWSKKPIFASDTTFYIDSRTTSCYLRWLYYVLQTLNLDEGSNEAAVPGLNRDDAYQQKVLLPPPSIQRAIADYLDRETAKLDDLIAAKRRLLDLLAEKRRALITHAVTRGLNPSASLRDSGVPWLGEIPAHWEVEFARRLFTEIDQRSVTGEEELLTVSHLTGVTSRAEKDVNMFMAESLEGYKICAPGDLVINTLWAWMGAMGVAFQHGIVSPAYNVYRPARYDANYLDFLVRIPVFATEVTRYSKGVWSSRLRLYPDEFFQVLMPMPPLEEQQQIAEFLGQETAKLDLLTRAAQETVDLLQERRSALIAAAVTGQIGFLPSGAVTGVLGC